jgi:hypothetical protein
VKLTKKDFGNLYAVGEWKKVLGLEAIVVDKYEGCFCFGLWFRALSGVEGRVVFVSGCGFEP